MADEVKVRTNNVPRPLIEAWELSAEERTEFDFLDWEAIEDGRDSAQFFRYKGELNYLGDFMAWSALSCADQPHWMDGWHAYASDSFFSGLVLRYAKEFEWSTEPDWSGESGVIVGRYYG